MNPNLINDTMEQYLANPAMSASKCREILRSPLHFKTRYIDPFEENETPALRFGKLAHAALLEPRRFLENFRVEPDVNRRTNAGKEALAAWHASLPQGAIALDGEEAKAIVGMCDALMAHPVASGLLKNGVAEHSLYWQNEATGMACKIRPDYLTEDGWLINVKTSLDASRKEFTRDIGTYDYHLGAAMQTMGFRAKFGHDPKGYVFVVCEKKPPYAVAVYVADDSVIEIGTDGVMRALQRAKACFSENRWPGYQEEAENISVPYWMMAESNF